MDGKIFLSLFCGCIYLGTLAGQPTYFSGSSRSTSLAGGGLSFQDINSLFINPSGIARLDQPGLLVAAERPYLLPELQSFSLALALPTKAGSFAFSLQRKGFSLFNRLHAGLVYARTITRDLTASLRLWLFQMRVRDQGSLYGTGFELGFQYRIASGLTLGGRLLQSIGKKEAGGTAPPALLALGLGYRASEKVLLLFEVEKAVASLARFCMGVEYQPSSQLTLRVGAGAPPASFSFGTGIHLSRILSVDASASYHPFLGFSPGISLLFPGRKGIEP